MLKSSARSIGPCLSLPENPARLAGYAQLDEPTSDGDEEIFLLTNLPKEAADACRIAFLYRKRWTIEGAFQELAQKATVSDCGLLF